MPALRWRRVEEVREVERNRQNDRVGDRAAEQNPRRVVPAGEGPRGEERSRQNGREGDQVVGQSPHRVVPVGEGPGAVRTE